MYFKDETSLFEDAFVGEKQKLEQWKRAT